MGNLREDCAAMKKESEGVKNHLIRHSIQLFITNAITSVDLNPKREEIVRQLLNRVRLAIRLATRDENKENILAEILEEAREEIIKLTFNLSSYGHQTETI